MRSVLSKSPLMTLALGNKLPKFAGGLRSKTVISYSGCLRVKVTKTDPPTYPVTPVLSLCFSRQLQKRLCTNIKSFGAIFYAAEVKTRIDSFRNRCIAASNDFLGRRLTVDGVQFVSTTRRVRSSQAVRQHIPVESDTGIGLYLALASKCYKLNEQSDGKQLSALAICDAVTLRLASTCNPSCKWSELIANSVGQHIKISHNYRT